MSIVLKYEIGELNNGINNDTFEYIVDPTFDDVVEFLEYFTNDRIKKEDFKYISIVLEIDFLDLIYDNKETEKEFKNWLKERYVDDATDEYEDGKKLAYQMKHTSFY